MSPGRVPVSSLSPADSATSVPTSLGRSAKQERLKVLGLAGAVVLLLGIYFGLKTSVTESGRLLPYQMLVRDLVSSEQAMFGTLKQSLLDAERARTTTGRWPEAPAVTSLPRTTPGADASPVPAVYSWKRSAVGVVTHYVGLPGEDVSAAAWLIVIREPEPGVPTDSAPNDEEHHRLADGTVLHVSIWTHRFGGQVDPAFVPQPEAAGWTQLLTAPLNPLAQPFAPLSPAATAQKPAK
jgi:hypothetical protein